MTGASVLSRPSPILLPARTRLKQETGDLHRAVEAAFDAADWFATPERYRDLLLRWSDLLAAFADSLDGFADRLRLAVAVGPRQALLTRDLADLGRMPSPPPRPRYLLPRAADIAQAFGCAYVLEGSSLGGRVLARRVADRLGPATPTRFLGGDRPTGGQGTVGPAWLDFLSRLEAALPTTGAVDRSVEAARQTFVVVGRALASDANDA